MDLGKGIVLLKASVKEGEYPTFTPENMIFLFGEVTLPDSVILNHSDPTECYVLFPPLVQLEEIYNLNKDPSWVGESMALTIRQPSSSAVNIVTKLVENKLLEEGEKYEILPINLKGEEVLKTHSPIFLPKGKLSQ